jgi:hypothetical protein
MWDLKDYMEGLKIRNDLVLNYILDGELIYFASRYDSKLGAFHIPTKKIVWQYEFQANEKGEIPKINTIKGNGNLLGALDMSGTLYIFKKENLT